MKIFLSGRSAKNPLIIPNCIVHDNFFFQNFIVKKETFLSIIISIGLFKIIWVQHIKIYFLKLKLFFKKWQRKKKSECNHTHVVNGMFDFRAPQKDYPNSVHRFISFRQRKNKKKTSALYSNCNIYFVSHEFCEKNFNKNHIHKVTVLWWKEKTNEK